MKPEAKKYKENMTFVLGEAVAVEETLGSAARVAFLVMGIVILLTTEFGVLDVVSRISADIVKVGWLRDNDQWSESRLYYCFLWGTIGLGSLILVLKEFGIDVGAYKLFTLSSSLNGAVMFIYSMLLLYLNRYHLPEAVRLRGWRVLAMVWSVGFFGFFAIRSAISVISGWF